MKKGFLVLIMVLSVTAFAFAEVIILKDDSVIKGKIIKLDEDIITVIGSFGEMVIERDNIKKMYSSDKEYNEELEEKKKKEENKTLVLTTQIILLKDGNVIKGSILSTNEEGVTVKVDNEDKLIKNADIEKVYFNEEDYWKEKYAKEQKEKEKVVEKEKIVEKETIVEKVVVVDNKNQSIDDMMEYKYFGVKLGTPYKDLINELKRKKAVFDERKKDSTVIVHRSMVMQPFAEYTLYRIKDGVASDVVITYSTKKETTKSLVALIGREFKKDDKSGKFTLESETGNTIEIYTIKELGKEYSVIHYFKNDKGTPFAKLDYKRVEFNIGFGIEHAFAMYWPLGYWANQSIGAFLPFGMTFNVDRNIQVGFVNDLEYRFVLTYGFQPYIHQFHDRIKLVVKTGEAKKLTKFAYEVGVSLQYAVEITGSGSSFLAGPSMAWVFESSNVKRDGGFQFAFFIDGAFGEVFYPHWEYQTETTRLASEFGATLDLGVSLRWFGTPNIVF